MEMILHLNFHQLCQSQALEFEYNPSVKRFEGIPDLNFSTDRHCG